MLRDLQKVLAVDGVSEQLFRLGNRGCKKIVLVDVALDKDQVLLSHRRHLRDVSNGGQVTPSS